MKKIRMLWDELAETITLYSAEQIAVGHSVNM